MDSADSVWDEFYWTTPVRFPEGLGPVRLIYAPEGRDERPLDDMEISVVAWTIDNLPMLWQALKPPLLTYYQQLCDGGDGLDPEDLPAVDSAEDVMALIELQTVNVHQVSKDGLPYAGLEFICPWDREHGLGILMHGSRMVESAAPIPPFFSGSPSATVNYRCLLLQSVDLVISRTLRASSIAVVQRTTHRSGRSSTIWFVENPIINERP